MARLSRKILTLCEPCHFDNSTGYTGFCFTDDGTIFRHNVSGTPDKETEYPVCVTYAAGDFEQARNVFQLVSSQETILDPRYTPTTNSITEVSVTTGSPVDFTAPLYLDDTRDLSRFFIIYEPGDNTTGPEREAEPLDLYDSRAVDWGDDFLVWQEISSSSCLPWTENEELARFCMS